MTTIVVTRYNETDDIAKRCLESLSKQESQDNIRVEFLDQKFSKAIKSFCKAHSNSKLEMNYRRIPAKSLSYARNYGIKISQDNLVIFSDVDCTHDSSWASLIRKAMDITDAAIIGTKIIPHWTHKPKWYHYSKYILEFYSMLDVAPEIIRINKIVGASFAIDKYKLREQAYFDEGMGRKDGKLLGGEETDLCARALKSGLSIYYTPKTYVNHWVEQERMSLRWLTKRAYFGGLSRSMSGKGVEAFNSSPKLIDYLSLLIILPFYGWGYIYGKIKYARHN